MATRQRSPLGLPQSCPRLLGPSLLALLVALLASACPGAQGAFTLGTDTPYVPGKCMVTGCEPGLCCGYYGFCGNSPAFCGSGCFNGNCYAFLNTVPGSRVDAGIIFGASLGALAGLVFVIVLLSCYFSSGPHPWEDHLQGAKFQKTSYSEVQKMTNNLSRKQVLGRGGLWAVYSGVQLQSGKPCAVKVHEEMTSYAFEKEVKAVTVLQHKNLATLVGYCAEPGKHVLVHEYDPANTLHARLYPDASQQVLSFKERIAIARSVAEGLQHLHAHNMFRCDVIPFCVLLPASSSSECEANKKPSLRRMEAKLLDLGLLREIDGYTLFLDSSADFSDYLAGNQGYVDPERGSRARVGWKVDVYRLGLLMLEIITGRPSFVSQSDKVLALACKQAAEQRREEEMEMATLPLPRYMKRPREQAGLTPWTQAISRAVAAASRSEHLDSRRPVATLSGRSFGNADGAGAGAGSSGSGSWVSSRSFMRRTRSLREGPMHLREWVETMRGAGVLPSLLDPRMLEAERLALITDPLGMRGQQQRQALELYVSLALGCSGEPEGRCRLGELLPALEQVERLWEDSFAVGGSGLGFVGGSGLETRVEIGGPESGTTLEAVAKVAGQGTGSPA